MYFYISSTLIGIWVYWTALHYITRSKPSYTYICSRYYWGIVFTYCFIWTIAAQIIWPLISARVNFHLYLEESRVWEVYPIPLGLINFIEIHSSQFRSCEIRIIQSYVVMGIIARIKCQIQREVIVQMLFNCRIGYKGIVKAESSHKILRRNYCQISISRSGQSTSTSFLVWFDFFKLRIFLVILTFPKLGIGLISLIGDIS